MSDASTQPQKCVCCGAIGCKDPEHTKMTTTLILVDLGKQAVLIHSRMGLTLTQLVEQRHELLMMVERYARECGECNGTGVVQPFCDASASGISHASPGRDEPCPDCADIRALLARVNP